MYCFSTADRITLEEEFPQHPHANHCVINEQMWLVGCGDKENITG